MQVEQDRQDQRDEERAERRQGRAQVDGVPEADKGQPEQNPQRRTTNCEWGVNYYPNRHPKT